MDKRWTALIPKKQATIPAKYISKDTYAKIGDLPQAAWIKILVLVPVADAARLARCCRKLAALYKDERVWNPRLDALSYAGPATSDIEALVSKRSLYYSDKSQQAASRNSIISGTPQSSAASPPSTSQAKFAVEETPDLFGDFVGTSSGHPRSSISFNSIDLSQPLPVPKPAKPNRREDDLLMLFDDDVEDMGLATASPAKSNRQSTYLNNKRNSVLSSSSKTTQPTHSASPSPSHDLFAAYYAILLPFFVSLQTQTTSSLIFTSHALSESPLARARLLSTLSRFVAPNLAPSRSITTLSVVRRNLQSSVDYFEASLLSSFEKAVDTHSYPSMRDIAQALFKLTGGQSVVQIFINKIPLFYEGQTHDPLRNLTSSNIGPDGNPVDGIDFAAMDSYINYILSAVKKQGTVIGKVFPKEEDVLVTFAERIAMDILDDYITPLLSASQALTPPLFLLTTAATFGQCNRITDQIMQIATEYGHTAKVTRPKLDDINFRLFELHMTDYLSEEIVWCRDLLKGICKEWDKKLEEEAASLDPQFLSSANPQQVKRNVLASFTKALLLPVTIVPKTVALSVNAIAAGGTMAFNAMTGSSAAAVNGKGPYNGKMVSPTQSTASLSSVTSPNGTSSHIRQRTISATGTEDSGHLAQGGFHMLLSIDTAMQLVQADRECLKRIQTFNGYTGKMGAKVKSTIEEVFIILCQTLSDSHLQPAFVRATNKMSLYKPADHAVDDSVAPLVQFFELVHIGDTIAQMVQVYYDRELAKYVDRNDFLSLVIREKKKFENALDESVASGLNAGVNILMTQAEYILQTQQDPRDFCPGEQLDSRRPSVQSLAVVTDIEGPTKAAEAVVECLRSHCDMLKGSTDKAILEIFHQEVGLRLHTILLKHLKKSIVSIPGGFQLIADLNLYTSFISSLKVPIVMPYFVALKMAANVFIIDSPKDLGNMARDLDRYEGTLRIEDVMEMVQCRTDWKKIEKQVEKEVFGFKAEDCIIQ